MPVSKRPLKPARKPVPAPQAAPFSVWHFVFLALALFVILALRRPYELSRPQFLAEDAGIYFRQQLLWGPFGALLKPYNGYVSIMQRLIALGAWMLPMAWTPLVYAVSALIIDTLCLAMFYLPWYRPLLPSDRLRLCFCLLLATVFYDNEVIGTLVNIQWPILLAGILLLFRPADSTGPGWRAGLWLAAGLLAGFTMPLLIVCAPFCLWAIWKKRSFDAAYETGLLISVLTQLAHFLSEPFLYTAPSESLLARAASLCGVALTCFTRVLILTMCGSPWTVRWSSAHLVTPTGIALLVLAVWWSILWVKSEAAQRVAIAAAVYFGLATLLLSAMGRHLEAHFADLTNYGDSTATRYIFLPECAFLFLVVLSVQKFLRAAPFRNQALVLTALFALGVLGNYRIKPFVNLPWRPYVPAIEARMRQTRMGHRVIPIQMQINPVPWFIRIP